MKKRMFYFLCTVVLPMLIGAGLYYIICPDVLFVKRIDEVIGISNRYPNISNGSALVTLFRFYFFDFIWAFAMTNALIFILGYNVKAVYSSFLITLLTGIALEILQKFSVAAGTFDVCDMVAEGIGALLAAFIYYTFRRKNYEKI